MGKITTYILMMSGLLLLFYFTGLMPEITATNTLLTMLLDPQALSQSPLGLDSAELFAGIIAGGILLGLLAWRSPELAVTSIFTISLAAFLWDFLGVFTKVRAESPVIAILLFSPILFLLIVTLVEWWRGRD